MALRTPIPTYLCSDYQSLHHHTIEKMPLNSPGIYNETLTLDIDSLEMKTLVGITALPSVPPLLLILIYHQSFNTGT
jgi:hypothetical protein